jgi:hypothetical protein
VCYGEYGRVSNVFDPRSAESDLRGRSDNLLLRRHGAGGGDPIRNELTGGAAGAPADHRPLVVRASGVDGIDDPWPAEQNATDDTGEGEHQDQDELTERDQERDANEHQEQDQRDHSDEDQHALGEIDATAEVGNVAELGRTTPHPPRPVKKPGPDRVRSEVAGRPPPPDMPHACPGRHLHVHRSSPIMSSVAADVGRPQVSGNIAEFADANRPVTPGTPCPNCRMGRSR